MGEAREIPVEEVLSDIRGGMSDADLMKKYELSPYQLDFLFKKLVDGKFLTATEMDARSARSPGPGPEQFARAAPTFRAGSSAGSALTGRSAGGRLDLEPRDPESKRLGRNALWGILGGIVIAFVGGVVSSIPGQIAKAIGLALSLGAVGPYFWGFYCLVAMKGYHWAWTFLGLVPCFLGLLVMVAMPNKRLGEKSSGALIVLVAVAGGLIMFAVMGIVLAIAIPYYVSYKRTVCDGAADADLQHLRAAYERYRNDANNLTQEPPRDLRHLLGPYYGWKGTTEKCSVRIKFDRFEQHVEAVSVKGSHPKGVTSRYAYRRHLAGTQRKGPKVLSHVDEATYLAYPFVGPGRDKSCFDREGKLIEECR